MRSISIPCLFALCLGLAGCGRDGLEEPAIPMEQVKSDLQAISQARIYFGHQSVGRNILAGVAALSADVGVPVHIQEIPVGSAPPPGPGLFHSNVGRNTAPESKVDDFLAGLRAADTSHFDLALLKFCYLDLDDDSPAGAADRIFERYTSAMAEARSEFPETAVLYTTMPILADPPGVKTLIKRMIGKSTWTDHANILRAGYNSRIRATVPERDVVDLARFESTRPDGSRSSFSADGEQIETLVLEYTKDGGHLNEVGQRRVASAFVHALAEALRKQAGSST